MLKRIIWLSVLIIVLLQISACSKTSTNTPPTTVKNDTVVTVNERLYHKYFDLTDIQKNELKARGYSEEQIANLDSEDFNKLSTTWKLSSDQILKIKAIYPELKNTDISNWTNSDFEKYSVAQTNERYAPTPEQAAKLEQRGISVDIAREMLKECQDYDTLLKQPDSMIDQLKSQIIKARKEYDDFIKYKNEIRVKYKESLDKKSN